VRNRAGQHRGEAFDIGEFHATLLPDGTKPLSGLEAKFVRVGLQQACHRSPAEWNGGSDIPIQPALIMTDHCKPGAGDETP
jgi:hypothetical protein